MPSKRENDEYRRLTELMPAIVVISDPAIPIILW